MPPPFRHRKTLGFRKSNKVKMLAYPLLNNGHVPTFTLSPDREIGLAGIFELALALPCSPIHASNNTDLPEGCGPEAKNC